MGVGVQSAPQIPLGYGLGLGAYPYGLGFPAPIVAAPAVAEAKEADEAATPTVVSYAGLGLPLAGYPYAGVYAAAAPAVPAGAISYTLGGVPFVVPAVAAPGAEEPAETAEAVVKE